MPKGSQVSGLGPGSVTCAEQMSPFLPASELVFSTPFTELGYTTVSDSLDHTFLLLPGHCLGMALFNLYYNHGMQKLCKIKNLSQYECNEICEYCKWKFALSQDTMQQVWACPQGCTRIAVIRGTWVAQWLSVLSTFGSGHGLGVLGRSPTYVSASLSVALMNK